MVYASCEFSKTNPTVTRAATVSDPGFHTVYLYPNFDAQLGSLELEYRSHFGPIRSAWSVSDSQVDWKVTLPPNTKGVLPISPEMVSR